MREARSVQGCARSLPWRRSLAFLALLAVAAGCERRESVVRVDSEREANRVLVVLHDCGVSSARKAARTEQRRTAWDISAAAGDDAAAARKFLIERNLPRPDHGGLAAMLRDGGMIPTPNEDRARFTHALASELERTLEAVEGVVEARVHLVLPPRDALGLIAPATPLGDGTAGTNDGPRATVLLKHAGAPEDGGASAGDDRPIAERDVRALVAGGIEGLSPDRVQVVYTAAAITPPRPSGAAVSPAALDMRHRVLAATTLLFAGALVAREWLLVRARRRRQDGTPATLGA